MINLIDLTNSTEIIHGSCKHQAKLARPETSSQRAPSYLIRVVWAIPAYQLKPSPIADTDWLRSLFWAAIQTYVKFALFEFLKFTFYCFPLKNLMIIGYFSIWFFTIWSESSFCLIYDITLHILKIYQQLIFECQI